MTVMMRDLPPDERPRERLMARGAAELSDAELLAVLIRTGTSSRSAIRLAEEVLAKYKGRGILAMSGMTPEEIASIDGIGPAKAATIAAAVELGRRLAMRAAAHEDAIKSPADAAAYAMPILAPEEKERLLLMLLDAKRRVLSLTTISVGGPAASFASPREVFREAMRRSAAALILLHNHPGGDPNPSGDDILVTEKMCEAGRIVGIPVLDHIIIGDDKFVSLKEKGMVK